MGKIINAYAKINLTLDVKNKRADGYHEVATVMQSVSLCDRVSVSLNRDIALSCDMANVPLGEENTAYKAAVEFFKKAGIDGGAKINIIKRIPMQAGLAGGSADAGAVINALNELYKTQFTEDELCYIGAKVGADVPFCILGGTKAAYGIGDKLFDAPKMPRCKIVIVKPQVNINTAYAYSMIDSREGKPLWKTQDMLFALQKKDLLQIGKNLSNDFEAVTEFSDLFKIKEKIKMFGAYGSLMSGSGSAVYGLFDENLYGAEKCAEYFKEKYGENVFLCTTV